jgi:Alpha/beta hydrolase domain
MLLTRIYRKYALVAVIAGAALLVWTLPTQARVTRIIIDATATLTGQDIPYETLTGRAFGELDPADPHNTIITDIALAPKNANGKVEYIASFFLVKPVDLTLSSGLMWHDVPNRGGRITITTDLRNSHDIGISSGWEGENAGGTAVPANASSLVPVTPVGNEWVKTPVLAGVTGRVFARIINRTGANAPLNIQANPFPYFPADSVNNSDAELKEHLHETLDGVVTEGATIPNSDWKFCYGAAATFASPGAPSAGLPVRVCLGNGRTFDTNKLYQVIFTAKDPYVLGAGTAAFRDVASFFKYAASDDFGTANPLAGAIKWAIIRGSSQSGNFTRHFIHLGMNQDEANRIVHEGAWPLIAGRRVANNSRWGQPDGVLELYQMGSEGPQWWSPWPDTVRGQPTPKGILDRCTATNTCPKIIENFGGSEVFALKMTTEWVGTSADVDIPLPRNVRRYYLPSSTHGGGGGGFNEAIANVGANCPGNNWGTGTLRGNPVPSTQLVNRLRVALRDWLMNGTLPPPSRWPTLVGGNLVDPTKEAMGFPSGVPGIPDSIFLPENFINPVFDYDFGPQFDHTDATGNPTNNPPLIKSVIRMKVPRVDADGNELGGVPTVLRDAPLGTYLGWNITSSGFHVGQVCDYVGGMVPFAKTKAERLATGDPRLSLEERYGTHDGYVAAVRAAANNAACQGYLLAGPAAASMGALCTGSIPPGFPDDWADLVNAAIASNVCNQPGDNGKCNPAAP